MTRTPIRRALPALVALALLVGACSSSDGSDGAGPTTAADGGSTTTTASGDDGATTTTTEDAEDADPTAAPEGEVASAEPVASAGCGTSTVAAVTGEKRTLPDSDRWYRLTTPAEHDGSTPLPLVIDFHGLSEGADIHALFSDMEAFAPANGFVTVLPNGTGTPVAWAVSPDRAGNPDLVFVDALLDQVEQDLCIDTSRVYATGLSNGAFMSSVVACTMADRFAAVAPVAGVIHPEDCDPSRPVPVLAFHGTADPILLFNGGVGTERLDSVIGGGEPDASGTTAPEPTLPAPDLAADAPGYPANAAAWAEANGCTGEPIETDLTDTVVERTWDCPAESPVVFDIVEGGGHSWPGSTFGSSIEAIVGPTDQSISANELMWAFFQRFTLPAT